MIAGTDLQKAIRVWCIKLRRRANHQVEIIAADVLGPELSRIRAPIPLALHRAKQITDVDDVRVALDCLLEMHSLECLITMRVIVMPVARKQKPFALSGLEFQRDVETSAVILFNFHFFICSVHHLNAAGFCFQIVQRPVAVRLTICS